MKRPLLRLDHYLKQSYLKMHQMNGRLRNTEKSIKGTSCRRSMMMNINVVMLKCSDK